MYMCPCLKFWRFYVPHIWNRMFLFYIVIHQLLFSSYTSLSFVWHATEYLFPRWVPVLTFLCMSKTNHISQLHKIFIMPIIFVCFVICKIKILCKQIQNNYASGVDYETLSTLTGYYKQILFFPTMKTDI